MDLAALTAGWADPLGPHALPAWAVQGLGWVGAVLIVASFQARTRLGLVRFQIGAFSVMGTHFLLLGAWTGAAMTFVGVARLLVVLGFERAPWLRTAYLGFFPLIWAAAWATADGWAAVLPAIGYTLGTYGVWQRNLLVMRLCYLGAHPFWLAYDVIVGSHGGVALECANIVSSTTAILRHHLLPARRWRRRRAADLQTRALPPTLTTAETPHDAGVPPMSTVIRFHETGGPDVLTTDHLLIDDPGPNHLRLRQTFCGVNFIDTYHRSGLYPLPGPLPSGCGLEAAGVVEAVGEGVEGFAEGDRVAYGTGPIGSYAERRLIPADKVVKLPEAIDERTAASMMLRGMTVEYLTRRLFRVEPGMTVLFHAAAGGVGLIACQWLAHLGATVIGTVGSEEKAVLAREHGCHHTILYREEDFVARVREITGGAGVPVVYDGVGAAVFEKSLDCLAPRGMMVQFGNASGPAPAIDPLTLSQKGALFLTRPTLMAWCGTPVEMRASAAALFEVVGSGAVKIAVGKAFPLAEAADAHRWLEGRHSVGSTILEV